jgi:signal transduction histidine kinase
MNRLLRPVAQPDTYRRALFALVQLGLGVAGFILLIAGWTVTCCLAITPLVVPLLIGLRIGVGLLAAAEASVARNLLGVNVRPRISTPGVGFWNRGFNVLRDGTFWRQQGHLLLAWPLALLVLAPLSWAAELVSLPAWYSWVDSADVFGFLEIDSFVETLPIALIGLGLLVGIAHLLGPWARLNGWLASRLLAGDGQVIVRSPAERRALRRRALTIDALVSTVIVAGLVVIWFLTGEDYFWPIWPLLALSLVVAIPGWIYLVLEHPAPRRLAMGSHALAIQIGVSVILSGFLVAIWAITTGGYFWPVWPIFGLAVLALVHGSVLYAGRQHRVEVLEASRAGAVDAQEAELRRIERDLHDGAQARLVALGMSLGMAEQKLQTDPEAVQQLIAEARHGATEALEELRVLARGIHPPILTDRGLGPAVAALTARSPLPSSVSVDVTRRPPAAVETAAYFVVAEALANVSKHAEASRVDVRITTEGGTLVAEVEDDGRGGAVISGNGLTGLRQRVEALDGTLMVTSPAGGPTTVRTELPCGS